MKVELCSNNDSEAWDTFISNHPDSTFYHLYGWRSINQRYFGHKSYYIKTTEDNDITGVLPVIYIKSIIFGRIFCSMPFVNFGGICSNNKTSLQLLLDKGIKLTKQNQAQYLEIRSTKKIDSNLAISTDKVSMTIQLQLDPSKLWDAFSSKHRTNIRRAYKNGLSVKCGGRELVDIFYSILSRSWKALGTPIYRKTYFYRIFDEFEKDLKIFICYHHDQPIAVALNGHFRDTVEGMWAGVLPEARKLQSSYVLYWEMIKDACESGYKQFHLGRSSVESGGEQFKKKWNADVKQLYWNYYLHNQQELPQLNVKNPKFELAIKLWRKLPLGITTTFGPFLAKNIP